MISNSNLILVDGHVHIYGCYDLALFFSSAYRNFLEEAERQGKGHAFTGVLLLTESLVDDWFGRLASVADTRNKIGNGEYGTWTIERTNENCSLVVRGQTGQNMIIIPGRQIVSAEKIEVSALVTTKHFEDGARLEEVIQMVKHGKAIPVIPWGVGKWLGRRGRLLRELIQNVDGKDVFLGDIGGRPLFWPRPSLFQLADRSGIRILSGTDPLPLKPEALRPASFGFAMSGPVSRDRPGQDIKHLIESSRTRVRFYGRLQHPFKFLRNQLLLRLH